MSKEELIEMVRMVSAGRRDAADSLAELIHSLLPVQPAFPAEIPVKQTRAKKAAAE